MKTRISAKKILIYAVCVLLTAVTIAPILICLFGSTKSPKEVNNASVDWAEELKGSWVVPFLPSGSLQYNWDTIFTSPIGGMIIPIDAAFKNSLMVAATSAIFATLISSLTAYGFATYRFKGRKLLYGLIFVSLAFPMNLSVLGYVGIIRTMGLFNTLWALIIYQLASPIMVFLMERYISSTVNREVVEAGRIDGASEIRIFRELITPIITPALGIVALFIFAASWNSWFFPEALIADPEKFTVPMVQSMLKSSKYAPEMGAAFLAMSVFLTPVIALYLIYSRYILRGTGFAGEVIYAEFKEEA